MWLLVVVGRQVLRRATPPHSKLVGAIVSLGIAWTCADAEELSCRVSAFMRFDGYILDYAFG